RDWSSDVCSSDLNHFIILCIVSNELWYITCLCILRLFAWIFYVSSIVQKSISNIFGICGVHPSYDISRDTRSCSDCFLSTTCRYLTYHPCLSVMCDSNSYVYPLSRVQNCLDSSTLGYELDI